MGVDLGKKEGKVRGRAWEEMRRRNYNGDIVYERKIKIRRERDAGERGEREEKRNVLCMLLGTAVPQ